MKKRILFPAIGVASFIALAAAGTAINNSSVNQCNKGDEVACNKLIDLPSPELYSSQVTNPYFADKLKLRAEATKRNAEAEIKRKAEIAAAAEASRKRLAEQAAKERAEIAAAEAKFKAEGWFELDKGIYGRWCTHTCSRAEVIGSSSYWLMEVWAKDRAAGDIYAQINVMQNGTVVGWTNDTAFLSKGQRGVLTFQKYGLSNGAAYGAQLTKFNARGSW